MTGGGLPHASPTRARFSIDARRCREGAKRRRPPPAMTGVYISFPFCQQKCTYCNFASGVFPESLVGPYIETLVAEIGEADSRRDFRLSDTNAAGFVQRSGPLTCRNWYGGRGWIGGVARRRVADRVRSVDRKAALTSRVTDGRSKPCMAAGSFAAHPRKSSECR